MNVKIRGLVMENEIMVSVCCLAYNHSKYIRQCLDGFVNQKTNFKFEVLIHDDASTDGTQDIIKEYEEKYPDIIKPIYQTENQYSKGIKINKTFQYPRARGKYITTCEGDDYWCDENKLQMQLDFLENHLDYSACVHNTMIMNCRTGEEHSKIANAADETLSTEQVLFNTVYEFHTSSIMFRKEFITIPDELVLSWSGDCSRAAYLALCGKIFRFAEVMSVYRFFAEGSYTEKTEKVPKEIIVKRSTEMIPFYRGVDKLSNYKYHDDFERKIAEKEFEILLLKDDYKKALKKYPNIVKGLSFRQRIALIMDAYFPLIAKLYRRLKNG